MNTVWASTTAHLPKTGENVIILLDLEFGFERSELEYILNEWHEGTALEFIANKLRRDPDEVFLALFHLGRGGKLKRPMGLKRFLESRIGEVKNVGDEL